MRIQPPHLLTKLRNIPWGHVGVTQLVLVTCMLYPKVLFTDKLRG
jgi:hypothetical protein